MKGTVRRETVPAIIEKIERVISRIAPDDSEAGRGEFGLLLSEKEWYQVLGVLRASGERDLGAIEAIRSVHESKLGRERDHLRRENARLRLKKRNQRREIRHLNRAMTLRNGLIFRLYGKIKSQRELLKGYADRMDRPRRIILGDDAPKKIVEVADEAIGPKGEA